MQQIIRERQKLQQKYPNQFTLAMEKELQENLEKLRNPKKQSLKIKTKVLVIDDDSDSPSNLPNIELIHKMWSDDVSLPDNINIAIVGAVSAGKSTLLNSLFVNQYSDMKIKRTTMTPQVYHEVPDGIYSKVNSKDIMLKNQKINNDLIAKTEKGDSITLDDIPEATYYVPKVHKLLDLHKDVYLTVYDIPGLNDARTKEVYYKYMNTNFHKFDIIIFVIDIMSALNTSDEIDILDHIITNCKNNRERHGIINKLVVLANKCDDMFLQGGHLKMDDEKEEMMNQIRNTVDQKIKQMFPELNYVISRISCEDSYIYRMYDKDPNTQLDIKHINKFGYNEYGKSKWNSLSESVKAAKINELMKNINMDKTLHLTGFLTFANNLKNILSDANQYEYLMNHHKYQLNYEIQNAKNAGLNILQSVQNITHIFYNMYLTNELFGRKEYEIFYKNFTDFVKFWYDNNVNTIISNIQDHNISQLIDAMSVLQMTVDIYPNIEYFGHKYSDVVDAYNHYYANKVNNINSDFATVISQLYKLVQTKYNKLAESIAAMFRNTDLYNKKPHEIIDTINKLINDKVIDREEATHQLRNIIINIYTKINGNNVIGCVNPDNMSNYVFVAYEFWNISNDFEMKYLSARNMHLKINSGVFKYNPEVKPELEKYYMELCNGSV